MQAGPRHDQEFRHGRTVWRRSPTEATLRFSLNDLLDGMPTHGALLADAASVCLEEREHSQCLAVQLTGSYDEAVAIEWYHPTAQVRSSLADPEEATEWGACALAILIVRAAWRDCS